MITKTIVLKSFNELSQSEQKKVISNNWDINIVDDWDISVIDFYSNILKTIGFDDAKIRYSGFFSQGDGASFIGNYKYKKGFLTVLKKMEVNVELITIANQIITEQKQNSYKIGCKLSLGSNSNLYCHKHTIDFYFYDTTTGEDMDKNEYMTQLFRDLMQLIYMDLENDYSYFTSKDAIIDELVDGDYYFDDGLLINK